MKTDCATHFALSYCRVSSCQPAGSVRVASVSADTGGRHSGARGALETIPPRIDSSVAQCVHFNVRHLSVGTGQTGITLAF